IHSMHTPYRSSHKLFIFAPNLVSVYMKSLGDKVPVCHKFPISRLCLEMVKSVDVTSPLLEKKSLLYFLCSEFDKTAEYVTPKQGPSPLIYRMFEFIQAYYGNSCTLHDLSSHMGYDYSYLSSYFKRIVGMSFNDYVNQVRVSHASYLLSNTDLGILSVSNECGFKSLRSFNRNFKEHMTVTPTEYRARLQKQPSDA
ncbi:MAG: helix-turn-helix transcriptional regulator, partial [Clostridia bacterium]|nr:helix-turn-helix transcriptional regulator [Clostridia bacterium]